MRTLNHIGRLCLVLLVVAGVSVAGCSTTKIGASSYETKRDNLHVRITPQDKPKTIILITPADPDTETKQ